MPASQQLPIVSLHSSWKTATLSAVNPRGCLVLSWSNWLSPAPWGPGTSCTYGWTMAPSICGGRNLVSPLKAMGLLINLRLNARASSLLRSPPGVCLWSPYNKAFTGNSCNGRRFVQVSVLLALIIKGNVNLRHPPSNRAVWLRAFLMEATSATNDNLLSAQDSVAGSW